MVLGMAFFNASFTFSNFYLDFYFLFSLKTFISLFSLDFCFTFRFGLLFPFFLRTVVYFPFLFGLLFPFSLWTFVSLFPLDFYFPFLFGHLFNYGHILDFFQIYFRTDGIFKEF